MRCDAEIFATFFRISRKRMKFKCFLREIVKGCGLASPRNRLTELEDW
jgi:hypothetical protein